MSWETLVLLLLPPLTSSITTGKWMCVCRMRRLADCNVPLIPKFYASVTHRVLGISREEEMNRLLNSQTWNDLGQKQAVLHYQNTSLKHN